MQQSQLFTNYKSCELCRRPLPLNYKSDVCPACEETALFHRVRDYIRQNDVTEYNVADHFGIPLSLVKKWIREGRIEYKENSSNAIISTHCQRCGAPVTFGTICPKCLKALNSSGHSAPAARGDSNKMRYLENADVK